MFPESKVCKDCRIEKPAEQFDRTHKVNLQPYCKDCTSIRNKAWYVANAEYKRAEMRLRRELDPNYTRTVLARSRAKAQGRFVEDVDANLILERDDAICGICGLFVDLNNWEMDHVLPYACGGTHEPDNVQVAHTACNRVKNKYTSYSPYSLA